MSRLAVIVVLLVLCATSVSQADPILQVYLEGGTYNTTTESWELTPSGSSAGEPFRIWVLGNVDGPGGHGPIDDVRMSLAYDSVATAPQITLTPSTTGGFGAFGDPSVPLGTGTHIQTVTDGSSPILGDGRSLPTHGIYGSGTDWQEFSLGDFTLTDSPIADFIGGFPTPPSETSGQINVYEVSVFDGGGLLSLHIDVYNTVEGDNHARFAPFSHDGDGDANIIPAPGAALLAMIGFPMVGWARRRLRPRG